VRPAVCYVLISLQVTVPLLCHGHMCGPDADLDGADAAGGYRWIPPHIHTHHLPFWPFDEEDDHQHDDHQGCPVPGGPAVLAPRAGLAPDLARLFGVLGLDEAAAPALAWVCFNPPTPVAHSPPGAQPPGQHPPLYLTTLSLLI
jgi:hypothetical protein